MEDSGRYETNEGCNWWNPALRPPSNGQPLCTHFFLPKQRLSHFEDPANPTTISQMLFFFKCNVTVNLTTEMSDEINAELNNKEK